MLLLLLWRRRVTTRGETDECSDPMRGDRRCARIHSRVQFPATTWRPRKRREKNIFVIADTPKGLFGATVLAGATRRLRRSHRRWSAGERHACCFFVFFFPTCFRHFDKFRTRRTTYAVYYYTHLSQRCTGLLFNGEGGRFSVHDWWTKIYSY